MVGILEVRQHHFVIKQHLQSTNVVAIAKHDIVPNSIAFVNEVLISFRFHY